jgi:hypothetical protein
MAEGLAQLVSSCLERFQRRGSASTASTQPDPEVSLKVTISAYAPVLALSVCAQCAREAEVYVYIGPARTLPVPRM